LQGRFAALVEFTQSVNSTPTKTPWMAFWLAAQGIAAEILFAVAKRLERKARFFARSAKNAPRGGGVL
jgi:hypothetical protein